MTGARPVRLICVSLALVGVGACKSATSIKPPTRATIADSADQVMYGVRTLLTDRGVLRAELLSDTAYVFDENTRFELRGVHTTFYRTTGAKDAVLTSKEGTYRTNANNMQARKDVVVLSEDGRQLTTAELRFDQTSNEIASDSAFVLTEPGRRLEGIGFRSDPDMNNVRVLKGAQGSMGQVAVPAASTAPSAGASAAPPLHTSTPRPAPRPSPPGPLPPGAVPPGSVPPL